MTIPAGGHIDRLIASLKPWYKSISIPRLKLNTSWAELRQTGNSMLVKASAAFPFVGYFILFNQSFWDWFNLSSIAGNTPNARESLFALLLHLRLYFLFFGLLLLGIGSGLYQLFCPYFIKKYGDRIDYINAASDHLSNNAVVSMHKAVVGTTPTFVDENVRRDALGTHYRQMSESKPIARRATKFFFVIGLVLLLIPTALTTIRVFSSFWGQLHF